MAKTTSSLNLSILGRSLVMIQFTRECLHSLEQPEEKAGKREPKRVPKSDVPVFVTTSWFLMDCYRHLMKSESEVLHYVTGWTRGNIRSLERLVPVDLSHQSMVRAEADLDSLALRMIEIQDFGLRPLAYFHSHPSSGLGAVSPSGTDLETQKQMEKSGSDIIGGIFSRDGFVRFYANGNKFRVRVIGNHVKEVQNNVFQIKTDKALSLPTSSPRSSRRRGGRQAAKDTRFSAR